MEKENMKINELNNNELIRLIYKEIIETKEAVNKENVRKINDLNNNVYNLTNTVTEMKKEVAKIEDLTNTVTEMGKEVEKIEGLANAVTEIKKDIKYIKNTLDVHTAKLEEHDKKFEKLENKVDKIGNQLDNLDKIERLHFEYTRHKMSRLDKKIDNEFSCINKEIDTKVSCLNNKIENEIEERKLDISKIEGVKEYDRIVLNDFGSRISILEEETEKYNTK